MKAPAEDPVIAEAKRRMLAAAALYRRAVEELRPVMAALEAHPDFDRTVRARRGTPLRDRLTLAYWLHDCIRSAIHDGEADAGEFLQEDATGGAEASMALFIEAEKADVARRVRKGRAAA